MQYIQSIVVYTAPQDSELSQNESNSFFIFKRAFFDSRGFLQAVLQPFGGPLWRQYPWSSLLWFKACQAGRIFAMGKAFLLPLE
jgi:hypothetical protein